MEDILGLLIIGLYGLTQTFTTALLIWRVARPAAGLRVVERVFYTLCLVFVPTGMLVLAILGFSPDWKGGRSHGWFGVIDVGWPGLMILPLWLTAGTFLFIACLKRRWIFTSKTVLVAVGLLAFICFWYVGMFPIYTGITGESGGLSVRLSAEGLSNVLGAVVLASVPAVICLNLVLLMIAILRRRELTGRMLTPVLVWLSGLVATAIAKCVSAVYYYESLPDEAPTCFVVTAAARGHSGFVGARVDPNTGLRVNRQLRTMRAVESRLIERHPQLHRALRGVYNVVGPAVAGRIRSRIAADAAFVLLKPIELLGACYLRCSRRPGG